MSYSSEDGKEVEMERLIENESERLAGDEKDDEEYLLEELQNKNIFTDIATALSEARFAAPMWALISILVAYYFTIGRFDDGVTFSERKLMTHEELRILRPILTQEEMLSIQKKTMHAETEFIMPFPSYDRVKIQFHSSGTEMNHQPPELFYSGVVFGISSENSHDLEYTRHRNLQYIDLHRDLLEMRPHPTAVMYKTSLHNATSWNETGYAVYFDYEDLESQGMISSDKLQPWKRVLEDVLVIARNHKQAYITVWYPHTYGANDDISNPHKHQVIIQSIIPTRTGLHELKSTCAVWMTAINRTKLKRIIDPHIYNKEMAYNT